MVFTFACRICNGCKSEIKDGLPVNAFGGLWHPQCLCCLYCHKPIAEDEVLMIIINTKNTDFFFFAALIYLLAP